MAKTILIALTNLALVLLVAPFMEGVIRKLKAVVHSRKGPPLIQPYLDLLKLLGKENLHVAGNPTFSLGPILTLGSILTAALFTPMGAGAPLGFAGDAIALVYFLVLATLGIMLGGAATGSPYGSIGSAREMMLGIVVEIIVLTCLIVAVIPTKSFSLSQISEWYHATGPSLSMIIAAVPFFLILQIQLGKLPFDIPEADQELMGGPFLEASGPKLALYKWGFYAKQIILASIFLEVFLPWPKTGIIPVDILINLAKVMVVIVIVGVVDAVNPRIRVDQAVRYFIMLWAILLFAVSFALIGV
jgi:formate hydrogenlyase subunit 4